jgi:hypothetical protein
MPNPVYGYADHGPADDGQVHHCIGFSDPAAVLASDDIQSEVKTSFDTPILAVGLEHLLGVHLRGGARAQQVLGFDFLGWLAGAIHATGQPSGLLDEGKSHPRSSGVKGNEATRFGPTAIAFTSLDDRRLVPRGKMRPTAGYRALAGWQPHRPDCL